MKYLNSVVGTTHVGLAFGPGIPEFIAANDRLVDYVELPFEQLRHAPNLASIQDSIPVILHCASLSVAGFVPPSDSTLSAIAEVAERTGTPWIGEHLAFVTADALECGASDSNAPTSLTYTVCPQLSDETVRRVADNLSSLRRRFSVPLILENSPQYFVVPGSTMSMVDFLRNVLSHCDAGFLLDLTHFLISMLNTRADAVEHISLLPLERVVEIHISGLSVQSGVAWDDHATPAPPAVFDLLERVLERVRPRAVTLEYNWSSSFPRGVLQKQLNHVRDLLARQ